MLVPPLALASLAPAVNHDFQAGGLRRGLLSPQTEHVRPARGVFRPQTGQIPAEQRDGHVAEIPPGSDHPDRHVRRRGHAAGGGGGGAERDPGGVVPQGAGERAAQGAAGGVGEGAEQHEGVSVQRAEADRSAPGLLLGTPARQSVRLRPFAVLHGFHELRLGPGPTEPQEREWSRCGFGSGWLRGGISARVRAQR